MKKITFLSLTIATALSLFSCKKDTVTKTVYVDRDTTIYYTLPSTYTFANVNDSDEIKLLVMADQIGAKINLANTVGGSAVSAQMLKDMFNNTGGYFLDSNHNYNNSGLKLSNYCSPTAIADINSYFDSVGLYSQSAVVASQGVAGVGVSLANKKLLLSPNGIFYSQLFKKTIMGILAHQIIAILTDSIGTSVDNNIIVTGSGTNLEHTWDKAFGFFGVPVTFPGVTTGAKYWGSYSNQVNAGLGSNATIMNAFLKGRAAISNKDVAGKTTQAAIIITTFDQLNAAAIVQEMKETDANIDAGGDAVAAYGTLSETLGFIRSLKYNTSATRIITDAQILELEILLDPASPNSPDLYKFVDINNLTAAQIKAKTDAIRQRVGQIYGFTASQLALQ